MTKVFIKYYLFYFLLFLLSFQFSCSSDNATNPENETKVPVVKIISPINNSSVVDSVKIIVQATDDKGITKVEIYIDDIKKTSFIVPPYEYTLYTQSFSDGSKHSIYAKAFDADGNVTGSEVVFINVFRLRPNNLRASIISDTEITLKWFDNSSIEKEFEIEQEINEEEFILIKTVLENITSTNISGIFLSSNTYTFRVRAVSDSLISDYSNSDSIIIKVPAPFDFTIKHTLLSQVKLEWNDTCSYSSGISVQRNINGGEYSQIATVSSSIKEYLDNSIDTNSTYSYKLQSYTLYNKSDYSKSISIEYLFAEMQELKALTGHNQRVHSVSFDKNGDYIISAADNIKIWDSNSYSLIRTLTGHSGQVFSIDIDPTNQILASGGQDSTLKLWDFNNGNLITTITEHTNWVTCVAFNPAGNSLASGSGDGKLKIWSTNDWSKLYEISDNKISSCEFNPTGTIIAYGCYDGIIVLRNASDGSLLYRLDGNPGEAAYDLNFSPDGSKLASIGCFNSITVWDVSSGQRISIHNDTGCANSVCFIDNRTVVAGYTVYLKLWDIIESAILGESYKYAYNFSSISKSPISNKIVTGSGDYLVCIWELNKKWISF